MDYSDQVYERIMGFPRTRPAAERTPEERQASWNEFWKLMDSMSPEELTEDIFVGRPLNTSILEEDAVADAHTA
jgi:hypothetical protein